MTTCSCVSLIPVVRPPVVGLLAARGREGVGVSRLHPISGLREVLFPIVIAVIMYIVLPAATPLINVLVLNGLFGRYKIMERLARATSGTLVCVMIVLLNASMNTAADTRTFLG